MHKCIPLVGGLVGLVVGLCVAGAVMAAWQSPGPTPTAVNNWMSWVYVVGILLGVPTGMAIVVWWASSREVAGK